MGILKQASFVLFALTLMPSFVHCQELVKLEAGLKSIKQDVKGQDLNFYNTRPYLQAGVYKVNQSGDFSYGTALNIAPNLTGSDIGNQLHWKVLDLSKEVISNHNLTFSAGALRNSKDDPAWGYSLGMGYEFPVFEQRMSLHINWARTNTDIGGKGADTGAKDNMIWLDIGFQF
jgi:hypothetical protein